MLASYRVHEMRVTRCANAGPVSLAHKGLPLPHCMQDILPSNLRKNFSYLAFWPCSITASHSKTVSKRTSQASSTHMLILLCLLKQLKQGIPISVRVPVQ